MIQRVQTLFLIAVVLCVLASLFMPFWMKSNSEGSELVKVTAFEFKHISLGDDLEEENARVFHQQNIFHLAIFCILALLLSSFSIVSYKNRLRQIKIGALVSLLLGGTLLFTAYYIMKGEKLLEPSLQGSLQIGFYLIATALICNSLANRFIRRDERLVRSADRIR